MRLDMKWFNEYFLNRLSDFDEWGARLEHGGCAYELFIYADNGGHRASKRVSLFELANAHEPEMILKSSVEEIVSILLDAERHTKESEERYGS